MDIHRGSVMNPISLAASASHDVEIAIGVVLGELLWRQPFFQKRQAARFSSVVAFEPVEQSFRSADRYRQKRSRTRGAKQSLEHDQSYPPTSRGKNNVSSAVGSNARVTATSPEGVRTAGVKPTRVSSLNRASAFKIDCTSFVSKLCRVSPV